MTGLLLFFYLSGDHLVMTTGHYNNDRSVIVLICNVVIVTMTIIHCNNDRHYYNDCVLRLLLQ